MVLMSHSMMNGAVPPKIATAKLYAMPMAPYRLAVGNWAGSAEATADAVREVSGGGVDYAIEATGHGEAMQAAVLSTRNRGAAVLIGIPREDTMLSGS